MDALSGALRGLRVVDLGSGMAPAIAAKLLAELGATVIRFEPAEGDPFEGVYPAYRIWHARSERRTASAPDDPVVASALTGADICILGGEDFPGYRWRVDAAAIAVAHPRLAILEIEGYPGDGSAAGRPAAELLVQARSGLTFEQYSGRPIQISFPVGNYGAALHGLTALMGSLCRQERDGVGGIARSSLFEGALTLATQYWFSAERPSGSFHFTLPKDPHPLIFQCRDGRYIHFVLGSFGSKGRIYRILEIDDPSVGPDDSGMPTGRGDPKNFFGDVDVLAAHVAKFDSKDLMEKILAAGVAANYVLAPGECWDDAQVRHVGVISREASGGRYVALPMHGMIGEDDPARRLTAAVPAGSLPLAGMRAVDFGIFVAGPFGSVALADLGADVIKVETLQGDPNRAIFRPYAAVNRGKRTIAIDMKHPEGVEITRRLAASAQILHSNFRPGVSARLGVDPATQHGVDPDKIVLEATGCGRTGPHSDRAGFDMIFQAFCGHEVRAGGAGNPPMWDRSAMVDYFLGALNGFATMIAAWRRFRGAGGADLELSLLDSGLFLMSELIETRDGTFIGTPLLNASRTGFHPAEALYACADGWMAVCARGDEMARALAGALGIGAGARSTWGEPEEVAIGAALAGLPRTEAITLLESAGVWVEPCLDGEALLADDSAAPGIILESEHAIYGRTRQIGALFRLGDERPTAPLGAAVAGAHTREILAGLGYSDWEIDGFYARKVVA